MANFIEFTVESNIHKKVLINVDLVLKIVPPLVRNPNYGCRLIFNCINVEDNDYMYTDVQETVEEVLGLLN